MKIENALGYFLLLLGLTMVCVAQTSQTSPTSQEPPCSVCTPPPPYTCTPPPHYPPPTSTPYTREPLPICPATPYPLRPPVIVPIPDLYQPVTGISDDGVKPLQWRAFVPKSRGPWPAVLIIHPGGFYEGDPFIIKSRRENNMILAAEELASKGYYALVVAYRLAPSGLVPGQACHTGSRFGQDSGIAPSQEYDVEALVKAARTDRNCNGWVGMLGGSAGGTHAVWAALDTSVHRNWPYWNWNPSSRMVVDDRADAAVSLSGAYDFSDRTPENYCRAKGDVLNAFQDDIENYTQTADRNLQYQLSPVALTNPPPPAVFDPNDVKPLYLFNSRQDPMPYHQITDMDCALKNAGVPASAYTLETIVTPPYCDAHAFAYWPLIKDEVIAFFDSHSRRPKKVFR